MVRVALLLYPLSVLWSLLDLWPRLQPTSNCDQAHMAGIITWNNQLPWQLTDLSGIRSSGRRNFWLHALLKCSGLQMYVITLISSSTPSIGFAAPAERNPQPLSISAYVHKQTYASLLVCFMKAAQHKTWVITFFQHCCPVSVIHFSPCVHQLPLVSPSVGPSCCWALNLVLVFFYRTDK